jgi:hypothetical protein
MLEYAVNHAADLGRSYLRLDCELPKDPNSRAKEIRTPKVSPSQGRYDENADSAENAENADRPIRCTATRRHGDSPLRPSRPVH